MWTFKVYNSLGNDVEMCISDRSGREVQIGMPGSFLKNRVLYVDLQPHSLLLIELRYRSMVLQ